MEQERTRAQCLDCEKYFWIVLTEDITSIPDGEAFECQCPYCESNWAQFPKEEEQGKEEEHEL